MIYQMGNLVRSADVRVAKVERVMPKFVEKAIEDALLLVRG